MTAKKFVLCFVAAGIFLPAAWFGVYRVCPEIINRAMSSLWVGDVVLLLWPSSILLLGDPNETSVVVLPIVSTIANAVLYGIIGALLWIGLKRSKAVLAVTVAAILAGWYGLLRL